MSTQRNFVNGQFVEPAGTARIAVYNPATEALIGHVPAATSDRKSVV